VDRVFLDANVLFSAAYLAGSGLRRLWDIGGVLLLTSEYAFLEAERNLARSRPDRLPALCELAQRLTVVATPELAAGLFDETDLPEKDRPILLAPVSSGATHLLTGDHRHFSAYLGCTVAGVMILMPRAYLDQRAA
jgi:hypothetical protein